MVIHFHESVLGQTSTKLNSKSTYFSFWFQIVWKVLNVYHSLFLGWLFFVFLLYLGNVTVY